jgi:hypothetical protein
MKDWQDQVVVTGCVVIALAFVLFVLTGVIK